VAAPDTFPGGSEVRAPEASPDRQARRGLAPKCGGAGPPWAWRPYQSTLLLPVRGGAGPIRARGGPETMIPAVRPGPHTSSPKGQGRGHG
jgi:hypothetical protein